MIAGALKVEAVLPGVLLTTVVRRTECPTKNAVSWACAKSANLELVRVFDRLVAIRWNYSPWGLSLTIA